jgi:CMP-N-acetylneuraminic acid synthetase
MSKKNVVAIILARGGSKGLSGKNTKLLLGHPLIEYTIRPVKKAKLVDRVIVSTDDDAIAKVAKDLGAEVPFIRPPEFSQDDTTSEASLKHALLWLKKNESYVVDILVYLQIPDLFKDPEMIDKAVKMLLDDDSLDSVFVAYPDKKNYWKQDGENYVCLTPGKHMSRQLKQPVFREDTGRGCATRARFILDEEKRLGENVRIISNSEPMIDIHDEFDLWLAEKVLKERSEFKKYTL